VERRKREKQKITKAQAGKPVNSVIPNVHHFRDEGLRDDEKPPSDRIVIFDEAQRAWSRQKAEQWMKSRKGIANFHMSEPEFLIQYGVTSNRTNPYGGSARKSASTMSTTSFRAGPSILLPLLV
jgi:hypothetical protein